MVPQLWIGQNCCYYSKGATQPLAALCVGNDESTGLATLAVFTAEGGRFIKKDMPWRDRLGLEGWNEIGQTPR